MIIEAKELWEKTKENILVSSYVGARANRDAAAVNSSIRTATAEFCENGAKKFVIGIPYIENLNNHFYSSVIEQIHRMKSVVSDVQIGVLTFKRKSRSAFPVPSIMIWISLLSLNTPPLEDWRLSF